MSEDVLALIEKAERSLSAAEMLLTEGHCGFAASRAYYSMFYVAEALLTSMGQVFGSHSGVIGSFGREFAKTERLDPKLHRWLIDAQDVRIVGDYGVGVDVSCEQTSELMVHAREFIVAGKSYLQAGGDTEVSRPSG